MASVVPYIRLDTGEYFVGTVTRIGAIDSLFPDVRSTAPSVLVHIHESNKPNLHAGEELRFTFFNPTLMRQWDATPANAGEQIRIEHNQSDQGRRWHYSIS